MISVGTAMLVGAACVCIEAFFSGSEIAMVSADRARLRAQAAAGDRGSALAERLLTRPHVLLATTLMGTNMATVAFSVTVALALIFSQADNSELLAVLMVTPMTLLFGEVLPKTMFQQHADRIVPRIIFPLHVASLVLRPGVWLLSGFAGIMTRLLGTDSERAFITRDELTMLIETEPADGSSEITQEERAMIANVFELSEAEAVDVMVPLSEVTALPEDTRLAEAVLELADKQHSRMPVFRHRIDDIVGVVHVFDLLQASLHTGPEAATATVGGVARPVMFVPETMPAVDLLVELQKTGRHIAIVVDEYGGAVGIVTVEDLLEEVVGEIDDEHDREPVLIHQERPGVWRVAARTPVERINHELSLDLPESEAYETVAGLLLERFKRIPAAGESMVVGAATVRVLEVSARAIETVQVLRRRRS
ncbi:hemolysin family protein [Haliangium sp.]|uniref:hemolysin family protein n=1 Tax=Haliangium sp. TaxID=2663208 RepID=UPI003D137CA4